MTIIFQIYHRIYTQEDKGWSLFSKFIKELTCKKIMDDPDF